MRTYRCAALLLTAQLLAIEAVAQTFPLEIRQQETPYNRQPTRGQPLSSTFNIPVGSDGRAPTVDQQAAAAAWLPTTVPTVKQFQGFVSYGALARPQLPLNLNSNLNLARNAEAVNLPRGKKGATIVVVMKSAQIGAPFMMRRTAFLFGSIIPVPGIGDDGQLLSASIRREDYWFAEPLSDNDH